MSETDKIRLAYLFKQFAANTISPKEYEELMDFLRKAGSDRDYYKAMDEVWNNVPEFPLNSEHDREKVYQKIISHPKFRKTGFSTLKRLAIRHSRLWWGRVAALLVCLIGLGIYSYLNQSPVGESDAVVQQVRQDIPPGGDKATLTLADGSTIVLDEADSGQLTEQLGMRISKTTDGQIVYEVDPEQKVSESPVMNTVATPRGGKYQIVLADGTKVWLNAASSLRYPAQFSQEERKVELSGEAYFEVAKSNVPFYVLSAGQKVQVLGTHFNINSYEDEQVTKTTLLEGAVRIIPLASSRAGEVPSGYRLKPGQEATFQHNHLSVAKADVEAVMAWKNNDFVFKDEGIESIMRKIARWYDIDVRYHGKNDTVRFGGVVSRSRNISAVLKMLESTGYVRFKVEGRRVTVML